MDEEDDKTENSDSGVEVNTTGYLFLNSPLASILQTMAPPTYTCFMNRDLRQIESISSFHISEEINLSKAYRTPYQSCAGGQL